MRLGPTPPSPPPSPPSPPLPTGLWACLPGPPRRVERRVASAEVWRLEGEGFIVWAKRPRLGRGFAQEREALTSWGLRGAPTLLAAEEGWLLLSDRPGEAVEALQGEARRRAFIAAGAWHRALHEGAPALGEPAAETLSLRVSAAARRAQGLAPDEVITALCAQSRLGGDLPESVWRRGRCHRDVHPRNWRLGDEGLSVLDWEHARVDLTLADLVKIVGELPDPEDTAAFLEGYGALTALEAEALGALSALHALNTLVYGLRHGDPALIALGARLTRRQGVAYSP